jgi:transposase-like protein
MALKRSLGKQAGDVKHAKGSLVGLDAPEVEKWLSERIRHGMEDLLNGFIQEELDIFVGAGKYERTDGRRAYRSGSYQRKYQTRVPGTSTYVPCNSISSV